MTLAGRLHDCEPDSLGVQKFDHITVTLEKFISPLQIWQPIATGRHGWIAVPMLFCIDPMPRPRFQESAHVFPPTASPPDRIQR